MRSALVFLILFLILGSCSSQLPIFNLGIKGRVVFLDPDPMCHFKYSESNEEILEKLLSADPFDLYDDDYEIAVPYKVVVEVQQRQLPRESHTMKCPRL